MVESQSIVKCGNIEQGSGMVDRPGYRTAEEGISDNGVGGDSPEASLIPRRMEDMMEGTKEGDKPP